MITACIAISFAVAGIIDMVSEYPHDPPGSTYVNFAIGIAFGLVAAGMLVGEVWG